MSDNPDKPEQKVPLFQNNAPQNNTLQKNTILEDTSMENVPLPLLSATDVADIAPLIKCLKSRHPLRIFVEDWISLQPDSKPTLTMLLGYLKRPRPYFWKQQTVAIWLLGMLDWNPEEQVIVRARLTRILTRWNFQDRCWRLLRIFGSSSILSGIILFAYYCNTPDLLVGELSTVFVVLMCFFVLSASLLFALTEGHNVAKMRSATVLALGKMHHVEDLPTVLNLLLERYKNLDSNYEKMANRLGDASHQALAWILPHISENDYGKLPGNTVPRLCRVLEDRSSSKMTSAQMLNLVEALHKLGDKRALPTLHRTMKRSAHTAASEAIREAIHSIEERERHLTASTTLLRASDGSTTASETLLRAATESATIEPIQLLRASSSEETK